MPWTDVCAGGPTCAPELERAHVENETGPAIKAETRVALIVMR
jgi:hypothetical protein